MIEINLEIVEVLAILIFAGMLFYITSWIVRYLLWRFRTPKFDANNNDENSEKD